MWRPSRAAAGLLLCLAAAAPMGVAAAQGSGPASNRIVNFEFTPTAMNVTAGTTVTWTNTADRPHTVTDRGGTFDNLLAPGTTATISFTVPGTYHYFCRINPSKMNGTIVVNPGPQPAATNRVEAVDPALAGETLRFLPNTLTAKTGSTVLFANVGGKPHTRTADDASVSFDPGIVPPGAEGGRFAGTNATFTLNKPGTFTFHCEIHPAVMKGTITVTGTATQGPAPPSA